jgi:acetylornithine deacetylase/succinyl-diaminopimelate desuccinylase-like protein
MKPKSVVDPVSILRTLIQFNTTNPPGNEEGAVRWVRELLETNGIKSKIFALTPNRPNLIARIPGCGIAPPILLYGHLDVVTTQGQKWQHSPFEGKLIDGYVWGRGALDMKGANAIFLAAFLRAFLEQLPLAGDVILALVADEENGGDYGACYLSERFPGIFQGVRYALGEFGGFTFYFAGKKFYPIMVSEKQICAMRAIIRGPGGHASLHQSQGTMSRLSEVIIELENQKLPIHITKELRLMIDSLRSNLPRTLKIGLGLVLHPTLTDWIIKLLRSAVPVLEPLVRNSVNATIVQGGYKINVIPSEIHLGLDGRLLPGFTPNDMVKELQPITGEDVEIIIERYDPGPIRMDMTLFPYLKRMLEQADPDGIPIPFLLPAVSDARYFSRLGIQTYGFTPMNLPPEFNFTRLIHAADERIPVESLEFGTSVVYNTLSNYGGYLQ